jgi:hypothetical protein
MAASGILIPAAGGGSVGGFICSVAGNVKLTYGTDGSGTTIVDTTPVVAGQFLPLPFHFAPGIAVHAALTGGCTGTFCVL